MSLLAATVALLTGDIRALDVAIRKSDGTHLSGFDATRPANATTTTVPVSTTSATLAAANTARRKLIVHNKSGKTLYVAFDTTAVVANAAFPVANNTVWESDLNGYTGVVSGILSSGTGDVNVTEVTD